VPCVMYERLGLSRGMSKERRCKRELVQASRWTVTAGSNEGLADWGRYRGELSTGQGVGSVFIHGHHNDLDALFARLLHNTPVAESIL
jgi:hypothetical protein